MFAFGIMHGRLRVAVRTQQRQRFEYNACVATGAHSAIGVLTDTAKSEDTQLADHTIQLSIRDEQRWPHSTCHQPAQY